MDHLAPDHRSFVRVLLQRSFGTAEEAVTAVCALLREELDTDLVYCTRIDDAEMEIVGLDDRLGSEWRVGHRWPLDRTLTWRAITAGGSCLCADLAAERWADVPMRDRLGLTSCVASPIRDAAGSPIGVLCAGDRRRELFTDAEMALLEAVAGILAREHELQRVRDLEAERTADLEASERRYRSLVDDLGDIIVEIDAAGRLTYVNRALTELTGLSNDDLGGTGMMDFVHPDDRETAAAHVAEALSGADTRSAAAARTVRMLAADGSVRWMSVRGQAIFGGGGEFLGFRGILHDVTDSVLAEQQVRQALAEAEAARDEAERASRAKSEFLSRMSHELRTPLNAILGFAQLLELGELTDDDGENVEQILRAGRHLLDLINEVLDVARVESGKLSLSIEPVDLTEIVTESLDLVRPAAAGRGITLRTPNRHDGSAVLADRQRLKQILVNLLSNAVKYNHEDGEVVVAWATSPDPGPGPSDEAPQGFLRLAVRDTGPGIPADRLDDVFTPFVRLDSQGGDVEGSGVGLSLTRTLAQALGGSVGVTSRVGGGSTFWVDLPAADAGPEAPAADATGTELTRTVLYVEDNPSNITLVRRVLARRPHVRLEVVQDGAEAVEATWRLQPDLVLLDLHLPGMSGGSILTALRGSDDERLRKLPVVVVTADLSTGTERRMLEAGATLFLPKPIDVPRLLDIVDEHLPLP